MYDEEVIELLDRQLRKIPSYKFIPLVPQLAPHMSNVLDPFTRQIVQVLERCAREHPHHTLPVLLALKNLYNDSRYCGKKVARQEPRVLGAQQLVQQLLSTEVRPIVQEMDRLSDALVMLAYLDLDKKQKGWFLLFAICFLAGGFVKSWRKLGFLFTSCYIRCVRGFLIVLQVTGTLVCRVRKILYFNFCVNNSILLMIFQPRSVDVPYQGIKL